MQQHTTGAAPVGGTNSNIKKSIIMEKLSSSKLRTNGYTAFEIEIANYIRVNDLQAGSEFNGVPGHKRYGSSSQRVRVLQNDTDTLQFARSVGDGEKVLTIDVNNIGTTTTTTQAITTPPTDAPAATATTATGGGDAIANALAPLFEAQRQAGRAEAAVEIERLKAELQAAKQQGTGTTISVTVNGQTTTTTTEDVLDPQFEFILNLVTSGENVYLYGPAGSGKNTICAQVAKALNLEFYYQNTLVTKFDISGYKNAQGEFEETAAYKAMKNGGLLMLDELDNSQAEAIIALNAALANGYYTFGNGEQVKLHKNFRCMAAGNTNGQGATEEYCGRFAMDESSRDRFAFIHIDYNCDIEKSLSKGHTDILEFVHDLRNACKSLQIKLIAGYRAIGKLAKFYETDTEAVLNAFIFRGMQKDDIRQIAAALTTQNKYTNAVKELLK